MKEFLYSKFFESVICIQKLYEGSIFAAARIYCTEHVSQSPAESDEEYKTVKEVVCVCILRQKGLLNTSFQGKPSKRLLMIESTHRTVMENLFFFLLHFFIHEETAHINRPMNQPFVYITIVCISHFEFTAQSTDIINLESSEKKHGIYH